MTCACGKDCALLGAELHAARFLRFFFCIACGGLAGAPPRRLDQIFLRRCDCKRGFFTFVRNRRPKRGGVRRLLVFFILVVGCGRLVVNRGAMPLVLSLFFCICAGAAQRIAYFREQGLGVAQRRFRVLAVVGADHNVVIAAIIVTGFIIELEAEILDRIVFSREFVRIDGLFKFVGEGEGVFFGGIAARLDRSDRVLDFIDDVFNRRVAVIRGGFDGFFYFRGDGGGLVVFDTIRFLSDWERIGARRSCVLFYRFKPRAHFIERALQGGQLVFGFGAGGGENRFNVRSALSSVAIGEQLRAHLSDRFRHFLDAVGAALFRRLDLV